MATSVSFDIYAKDRASKTFRDVGNSADGMGSKLEKIGKFAAAGAVALGAVTVAAGIFAYKVGSDYVSSLNKIQALTGANDATMKRAAETLESNSGLYAKMGQTTGDAASGVVELTKAGLSLHDSLKAVNGTMILAKAGELSVADASTLVANSLNTFGLKAKDAGKIANQLANAANISSADVSDLAESFKYVAPIAASAGVSMAQVNAILAELSNSGIKASNAGTGLRKFLLSLQAPSQAANISLQEMGVSIYKANGQMKPLTTIIGDLSKGLKGLSDVDRNYDLKNIFGLTGIASAKVILKGGTEGLDEYTRGVNRAGAAQKLAEAQTKGLAGTIAMMKATLTSTAQSLYRQFSPIVNQALMPLATWMARLSTQAAPALQKAIRDLQPTIDKMRPGINGLARDLGGNLGKSIRQIIDDFRKNKKEYQDFATSIVKATPPVLRLVSAIASKGVPAIIRLNNAMNHLPFIGTIRSMTGMVNGIGAVASAFLHGGDAASRFGSTVKSKIGAAVSAVQALPGKVRSAVGNLGGILFGAGQAVIQGFIDGVQSKIGSLVSKLHSITSMIPLHKGPIDKDRVLLKPAGVAIIEGLIKGIQSQEVPLQNALDKVTARVSSANQKLRGAIGARNSFAGGFQGFADSIFGADYGTDDDGNAVAPTAASILAKQAQQARQAKSVNHDVHRLVKMGLSPALLKQLQASGSSGIAEIQALASATPAQIKQLNALQKQTSGSLRSAGMSAGNRLYGEAIKADREQLGQLKRLENVLHRIEQHAKKGETIHIHLEGKDIIYSIDKHNRHQGKKSNA